MCFPELFLDKKGDLTITTSLRDVSLAHAAKHLIKFSCYSYTERRYIHPFAQHKRFSDWIHDMIQRHRTLSQANFVYSRTETCKGTLFMTFLQCCKMEVLLILCSKFTDMLRR